MIKIDEEKIKKADKVIEKLSYVVLMFFVLYSLPGLLFLAHSVVKEVVFGNSNLSEFKEWFDIVKLVSNVFWLSIWHKVFSLFGRLIN